MIEATLEFHTGFILVVGRVDGKRVYTSKRLRNATYAAKRKVTWERRIAKQIRNGRII